MKIKQLLIPLALMASPVMADTPLNLDIPEPSVQNETTAQVERSTSPIDGLELYGKAGIPGVGLGVGYGVNEKFTVRGDFTTVGRYSKSFHQKSFNYDAKLKSDKLDIAADFFPLENLGFRFTGGLSLTNTQLTAQGMSDKQEEQSFKIGGKTYKVQLDSTDTVDAKVKYPKVQPYLGIGWGHDVKRKKSGQWSFTADLGVYFGSPKTTIDINDNLREKLINSQLDTQTRDEAIAELDRRIDKEKSDLKKEVEKLKVIPVVMFGLTYRF